MELPIKLTIPAKLLKPWTNHINNIIATPNRYILSDKTTFISTDENLPTVLSKDDPTLPGVNDQFVLDQFTGKNTIRNYELNRAIIMKAFDIAYPPLVDSIPVIEYLEKELNSVLLKPSGNFLYPKGGYMGWHTNADVACTRVYLTYSEVDKGSCFKYLDTTGTEPKVVTDWDSKGWTVRVFKITNNPTDYFWHCVDAPNEQRFSYGYRFK